MTVTITDPTVAELVGAFAGAAPDRLDAEYQRLVGALWTGGELTGLALPAVPALVAELDRLDPAHQGYLAILLGLLAEAEYPASDGEVSAAVRQGLDLYLELVARGGKDGPLTLAVLYLLGHFPADRGRILAAAEPLALDPDDQTRLERTLQQLDPDRPDLGRVWPAPSIWALDEDERDFDQTWITDLTPEQVTTNWENDTRTVLAYTGMKAYWAVQHGTPEPAADPPVPSLDTVPPTPPEVGLEIFERHAETWRCPACHSRLHFRPAGARCASCATTYLIANGVLDLTAGVSDEAAEGTDEDPTADLLQKLAAMPSMGLYYEAVLRPAYLRLAGLNWGNVVTPADEDRYIAEHISPTDGPVLDVAAGAGRWTAVVAETVGADRLIALDMGLPMLNVLRGRLPEVPAVLASALALPFDDASFGAVHCWNALQAFPDDAATAIAEIGRCLRPGGTFTMLTFQWATDPIHRYYQASHFFPSRPAGMLLFEPDDIRRWLADAGMTVRTESAPGTFYLVTAERAG
jgi:SAM-dependent methyltransferase